MNLASLKGLLFPILSALFGLSIGVFSTAFFGENPLHIFRILAMSSFQSYYDFGMMLFYTTPLLFTGLSVAFAFRAGLFNIGGEGQLAMGALACTAFALAFPNLIFPVSVVAAAACACLAAGGWGFFAGWLKAKRGTHEVITTIMLNFISAGLSSYFILYTLKDESVQGPESATVSANYSLSQFAIFDGAPVGPALIFALGCCFLTWFWLNRSRGGFETRAVGENFSASAFSGIQSERVQSKSMFIAGAIAGLVGVSEVLGTSYKLKLGFSPGYGFTGVAVALLARGNPLGVIPSAFLFGILHKGSLDLELETERVTRDISQMIEALVVLSVSAEGVWALLRKKSKNV